MLTIHDRFIFSFDPQMKPAAECCNGDTVCFITEDCFCGEIKCTEDLMKPQRDEGNPATGPLFVQGAEPGDALKIEILDIKVASQGVCATFRNTGDEWYGCERSVKPIEIQNGFAIFNDTCWPIEPMIGVIGTAPEKDPVSTEDSFDCGGNMDNPAIIKGSVVYLPVRVRGGLLAMGDIHASMGEGEMCGTGIEIPGEITVRVSVIKNAQLNWPVTENASGFFVNTNGKTADEAIRRGYHELQRLIMKAYDWNATDANMYMSLQGYLASNQACLSRDYPTDKEGPTFRIGCRKAAGKPPLVG